MGTKGESIGRWRVSEGEEARLTPGGPAAAEVWSRGFLPLRVRSEGAYRLRPAFPGTAVALGGVPYEVLSETEMPDLGLVVYRLRPWPEGEVVRDRVVYGAAFVRAAEAGRERARVRERARPFRWFLYPLVGLLPEERQERLCDRLGLYAVTATLVSGLTEGLGTLMALLLVGRSAEAGGAIAVLLAAPGLVLLVLPGLGRAFGAYFLRETAGNAVVVFLYDALRALGAWRERHDRSFVPLTRSAFWERLGRPDTVESSTDGSLVYRGLLPHLTWDAAHRIRAGGAEFWSVDPLPPALHRGRLVYSYRLERLADPSAAGPGPTADAAAPTAYAEEILDGVRREWDSFNHGFVWLTSLLPAEVQARAFEHRGGPSAARRPTLVTAGAAAIIGVYLASFLPGPAGDPLAPVMGILALSLLVDAARRAHAARRGRYAPSLFRFLVPSNLLRPQRAAYHAHRDAERDTPPPAVGRCVTASSRSPPCMASSVVGRSSRRTPWHPGSPLTPGDARCKMRALWRPRPAVPGPQSTWMRRSRRSSSE